MTGPAPVPLALTGEIDRDSGPAIRELVLSAPTMRVEVDTSAVTFIDSAGLAVLVGVRTALESEGRRLVLVNRSANLERLLQITDLTDLFT